MAWVLLVMGVLAALVGLVSLGSARISIDKIESLLLLLIAAVLTVGAAVVRAVNRARIAGEPAHRNSGLAPEPLRPEDAWEEDDGSGEKSGRLVNILGAAFLAAALLIGVLWLVIPGPK